MCIRDRSNSESGSNSGSGYEPTAGSSTSSTIPQVENDGSGSSDAGAESTATSGVVPFEGSAGRIKADKSTISIIVVSFIAILMI